MIPKFRAINIKTSFWFDEQELVFCDGKWFQNWRSFEDGFPLNMRDCAVMQSTGLEDKNGVEIFEGDIVKLSIQNGFDYLDNELCTVKRSIGHSGLVCATRNKDIEYRIFNTELFEEYIYEVVGNVYQNNDLLEEAHDE